MSPDEKAEPLELAVIGKIIATRQRQGRLKELVFSLH
jgi:hypothetical protein